MRVWLPTDASLTTPVPQLTPNELIGHGRDDKQIAEAIGADWLVYQDLEDLIETAQAGNPEISRFETSVFDGEDVTGDVTRDYLDYIEGQRNDGARSGQAASGNAVIDLHNDA